MSRIKLLQASEIKVFNTPPVLNLEEQRYFFAIDEALGKELAKLRHPLAKAGFLLQWGYFKAVGRFFEVGDFRSPDQIFVVKTLGINWDDIPFQAHYNKQMAYHHRERILQLSGWQPLEETFLRKHIQQLVERQLMPRKVLFETQSYLFRARMESPAYDKYLRVINETLVSAGKQLSQALATHLTQEHKAVLDEFLERKAAYQNADIVGFKTINQSNRPSEIASSLAQFIVLKSRLERLQALIGQLSLSDAIIDYHAYWTTIADTDKIAAHSDRYLYLLCFLIHQIRKRHDFFIDIVLDGVKSAENATRRLQKEDYFATQKQRTAATRLLIQSRKGYFEQLRAVKAILASDHPPEQKVRALEKLLEEDISLPAGQQVQMETLEREANQDQSPYFTDLWEKKSTWLTNRIGAVLGHLMPDSENTDPALGAALEHYAARKGRISTPAKNLDWLETVRQDELYVQQEDKVKFRPRLYKMFLFDALAHGIKSGTINFRYSYRYRFLDQYLIDKNEWKAHKKRLLEDAELTHFADYGKVLAGLKEHLHALYCQTNENIKASTNPHFTFNREKKPLIATPAVEKPDTERVAAYFRPARYVSILSVLSDVEKAAPFLHLFGHGSKTDEKKRPTQETFFAAILAMGCNIGVDRMGRISKGVQASTLKHTADWYLSEQALADANNTIIQMKNSLALPEIHRKSPTELHTASDGQKILVKGDSLNATYSAKYPGFQKASSINTAIDERFASYYSAVITAADREAGNVADMHLGNPVVKSTMHSTDSHGGTEVIFGMMHFLSVFFAPRIKELGTLELYSFVSQKEYAGQGYVLLPDHYISEKLIETHWDDMLRVMVSLKLGKTTAFQVLKRMNSYAKQNPLQKAFKEFGKIIRTAFILRYYDDLELRQSVEKQLSHIEMMNRFAKAVFFGQNQEFQVATKQEQEKIILCRRLIQNAIVLWNYLYLSELLARIDSQPVLEEMISVIGNGTAVTWQHVNMMGEYDFIKLLDNKPLRFDLERIFQWKYAPAAKEPAGLG